MAITTQVESTATTPPEHDTDLPTCVAGDPDCAGIDGLFWGELSCLECWMAAPETALAIQMGAV